MSISFSDGKHQGEAVILKGSTEGLVFYLNDRITFSELLEGLEEKLKESDGFWGKSTRINMHIGTREMSLEEEFEIKKVFRDFGLKVKHLYTIEDDILGKKSKAEEEEEQKEEVSPKKDIVKENANNNNILAQGSTLLVRKNLRSGQSFHHDGTLIIMGDVNPGAEIVADGHILVIGHLRGIAHAGALGDRKAIVFANRLEPTQLRIADMITRSPDEDDIVPMEPEIASIKDDRVIIEKFV